MKLDTRSFRYLSQEDWRVLRAVELGSKNHEVVPTSLITQLASLHTGDNGCQKSISTLAKAGLIARTKNAKYDGYRLTYGGYDYLALQSLTKNGSLLHLGSQMGVGKESDIYLVTSPTTNSSTSDQEPHATVISPAKQSILKIHRLGRTSFRTIRTNRAYQGSRAHCSWQYLSRLSATKEYTAMRSLHAAGFPVPEPIAHNRHAIVMSLVPGVPLRQVSARSFKDGAAEIAALYGELMELTLRLASVGLIHGDYNEFNILLSNIPQLQSEEQQSPAKPSSNAFRSTVHLIDFPQITSLSHPQASYYFDRDVNCVKDFFRKRYHFTADDPGPTFAEALARSKVSEMEQRQERGEKRLDVAIEAAGFSRKMGRELEQYYEARQSDHNNDSAGDTMDYTGVEYVQVGEDDGEDEKANSYISNQPQMDLGNDQFVRDDCIDFEPNSGRWIDAGRPDSEGTYGEYIALINQLRNRINLLSAFRAGIRLDLSQTLADTNVPAAEEVKSDTAVEVDHSKLDSLSLSSANLGQMRNLRTSAKARAGWSI